MSQLYFGPHLHRALECIHRGNKAAAASWMERDIGESGRGPEHYPDCDSLRIISDPELPWDEVIEYRTVKDSFVGTAGDGI